MFIRPLASEMLPKVSKQAASSFFPSHAAIDLSKIDNVVISKVCSDAPAARVLEAPKAVIEKITNFFG